MYQKYTLLLTIFLQFLLPAKTVAQAIPLGTTADFVVFTSTGALSNSGTSFLTHLTGDVGTNTGAFNLSGNVNGIVHPVADGATQACAADLLVAYTALNNTIATGAHAPLLGNGETMYGGVYAIAGNTSLDHNLVLDAQGNADTVFIFKINGTLSTLANATVTLINGAKACNVFWKVDGVVSLGAGTVMRGTIVTNNAAIDMAAGTVLEGRALSTTGAITMNAVTAHAPVGCGSALHNGPAAPSFGSAACYAVLSGTGAVTNVGATFITGDVGTNTGAMTGYEANKVTGTIHPVPDASTAAASAALATAYDFLNALPTDIQLLFPAELGHSLVLTPHTYLLGAATTLTDTLFLNAEGNANAVFVIKINGALSTGVLSTVVLTNGAQALNVYWKVDGAITMNTSTHFNGTVVANNAAVALSTGTEVQGRVFTTNGAVSTDNNIVAIPVGGCASAIPLPLKWLYFTGTQQAGAVLLEWATTNEAANSYFSLERSRDGNTFEKIASIDAVAGSGSQRYSFLDKEPYYNGYYRISQTDLSGNQNYYGIIKVAGSRPSKTIQFICGNNICMSTNATAAGTTRVQLYGADGKCVASQLINVSVGENNYSIPKPEVKGVYLLLIEIGGVRSYTGRVLID